MNSLYTTKPVRLLNLYFQVHQPRRLRNLGFFDIGNNETNFDDAANERIIRQVAARCYQPVNLLLLKLIKQYPQLRITFSISGVALEQLEEFCPAVLESFRMLASTGSVEFLGETYYHSLCALSDVHEFASQVTKHTAVMKRLLGVQPAVFRNTELIYSDRLGKMVHELGFKAVYLDGVEKILRQRSPNKLYHHPDGNGLKLLLRNYRLSDDIAFRFSHRAWKEYPLTAEKFVSWIEQCPASNSLINLGMDYETFGEHQKSETGILKFLSDFLKKVVRHKDLKMVTPSEAIQLVPETDCMEVPVPVSWADRERDLSAWLGNDMQRDAFYSLKNLKHDVMEVNDAALLDTWRHLQTSDHFYYMSTKKGDDGNVHQHFSHYASPYEAFMNYMNALSDLVFQIHNAQRLIHLMRPSSQRANKRIPSLNSLVENVMYLNRNEP